MGRHRVKIGLLTSSRADYSIYLPLIQELNKSIEFQLELLAFGTHLSDVHGNTIHQIEQDGNIVRVKIHTAPSIDTPEAISKSMALTIEQFSPIWSNHKFDFIIALGDRYEMYAAVSSTIPFNIPIVHIHGGETTLGAIDNIFRHSISLASKIHFVSCEEYAKKLYRLLDSTENIYNVGALSIDNLASLPIFSIEQFNDLFKIDLKIPTVLITIHPETAGEDNNQKNINELIKVLKEKRNIQYLITMPNADPSGLKIRKAWLEFKNTSTQSIHLVENLGTLGYLSAMKHCKFMLGNTSSGFVEASYFPKWVINTGKRQLGRILTPNIIQTEFEYIEILKSINYCEQNIPPLNCNIYGEGNTASKMVSLLKDYFIHDK